MQSLQTEKIREVLSADVIKPVPPTASKINYMPHKSQVTTSEVIKDGVHDTLLRTPPDPTITVGCASFLYKTFKRI
jgi:hypothetical protein